VCVCVCEDADAGASYISTLFHRRIMSVCVRFYMGVYVSECVFVCGCRPMSCVHIF